MPLVPADRCMGLNDTDTPVAYTTPVFANYNGYGAEVRYVGDLTGVITIPAIAGLCRLTQWTVFGPASAGGSGRSRHGNVPRDSSWSN
jgi:hypothetical protein